MAIVASFTSDVTNGAPPNFTVQFTDTSTGSPTNWLWDFGDGTFSSDQSPQHTFAGDWLDTFTVKLKAWIAASTINIGMSFISRARRDGFAASTNEQAFTNWLAAGWGSDFSTSWVFRMLQGETNYGYEGHRRTSQVTIPASPSGGGPSVFMVEAQRVTTGFDLDSGSLDSDIGGSLSSSAPLSTWLAFVDVSGSMGATLDILFRPTEAILSEAGPFNDSGIGGIFRTTEYTTDSSDNFDDETKIDFITFGVPPVAAFSATPTQGISPLSVGFLNESTPAVGAPTTYVWKKRVSGSGDAFVQFSTLVSPVQIFDKESP